MLTSGSIAPMPTGARLILTCGLPGAGKTTLAERLARERPAIRFTKDEWVWALGCTPWDRPFNIRVEAELWRTAQEILVLGLSVVIDYGLWAKSERDEMRTVARRLGVGVELHYLHASMDELWTRVAARNSRPPWNTAPITRAHMTQFEAFFEPPDDAERSLVDSAVDDAPMHRP
jgi:predicted kinase